MEHTSSHRRMEPVTGARAAPAAGPGGLPPLNRSVLRHYLTEPSVAVLTRLLRRALGTDGVFISLRVSDDETEHAGDSPWPAALDVILDELCSRVVASEKTMAITDVRVDADFSRDTNSPGADIGACAAIPLITAEGQVLGSLCAVGERPREWTADDLASLTDAAEAVAAEVELRLELGRVGRNERYFRALVEHAQDIVTVLDARGVIRYESPSIKPLLGYAPDELLGRSAFEFVHEEDLPDVLEAFGQAVAEPGRTLTVEYRFRHRNGAWMVLESVGTGVPDPDGLGVVVHSRDVSDRRRAEQQLKVQQAYLEELFASAPEGIVILDPDDRVLRVNPEFTRIFGYSAEEAVGRSINDLIVPPSQWQEGRAISRQVAEGETVSIEAVRARKDGSVVEVSILATPIRLDGDRIAVFGIYRDISQRRKAEARVAAYAEELRALSLTDDLTGLYNRRGFFTLAEQELKLARDTRSSMVLLFIDVNRMKQINDNIGHAAGDAALRVVADALRTTFRASDVIARMGGDEFAVLAWGGKSGSGPGIEARLRETLASSNSAAAVGVEVSISLGCAEWRPNGHTTLQDLLAEADSRMYREKKR